ncbi:MAG: UDP-N-acetylmuramoyl-L-alanyl-D-glutamate--2,6-diaminopimelate ligase [Bacilli bacterium]|nr:UDP-N-acetylmuramoyl-L-alanyl-D-glutamate--2,6-diaminopimelate ligase [Bacilli bacterium]
MKKLKDLIETDYDIDIIGITDDSREVRDGFLFVATKGFRIDHFDYIEDAIHNGCVCVISDRKCEFDIPNIVVEDVHSTFLKICRKFYDVDLSKLSFIGITGTDGKTTTATIIRNLINPIRDCAYIGTNGVDYLGEHLKSNNTTPCIKELYEYLSIIQKSKCKDIVMEVSSEALLHDRVHDLSFSVIGYTNITEDHLNVHGTLENYIECKRSLMDHLDSNGICILNGDDEHCKGLSNDCVTYGMNIDNDCVISNVNESAKFTTFNLSYMDHTYMIHSPFTGIYNVYNVTLAFLVCLHYGLSPEYLVDSIRTLGVVKGRRELLDFGQEYDIILDYAHTLHGIESIIKSVSDKKKIVVTGCAGGREKSKRRWIGDFLLNNCDVCIFTMDDPRYESVDTIIDDMVGDTDKEYYRIIDRRDAIYKAFELADANSCVFILGKGRDEYMAIEDKKLPYCDYDVICSYFE